MASINWKAQYRRSLIKLISGDENGHSFSGYAWFKRDLNDKVSEKISKVDHRNIVHVVINNALIL